MSEINTCGARVLIDFNQIEKFNKFVEDEKQKITENQDYIAICIPSKNIYTFEIYEKSNNNVINNINDIDDINDNNDINDINNDEFDLSGLSESCAITNQVINPVNNNYDDDLYT
jgi:hypothetical protein